MLKVQDDPSELSMIRPFRLSPASLRFVPASGIAVAGILFALGRTGDFASVLVALLFVPVVASALLLLSPWRSQRISSPERVTLRLVATMVAGMSLKLKLRWLSWGDWQKRMRLRRSLDNKARPILLDQFAEFWKMRTRSSDLTGRLDQYETLIVSLEFLAWVYLVAAFFPLIAFYGPIIYFVVYGLPTFLGMAVAGFIFMGGWAQTRLAYLRLLRDQIPLLMVSGNYLDSEFWSRYRAYVNQQSGILGPVLTSEYVKKAESKMLRAKRGEFEKSWIEKLAAEEAGVAPFEVLGLVDAAIISERRSSTGHVTLQTLERFFFLSALFASVAVWLSDSNVGLVYLSYGLLLSAVVTFVGRNVWLHTRRSEDIRDARLRHLRERIAVLYEPLELAVKEFSFSQIGEDAVVRFQDQVDRLLEAHQSLALPGVLQAYGARKTRATDRSWATQLASAISADIEKLRQAIVELSGEQLPNQQTATSAKSG
jgi:hypothetical protein